jgi:hypothetical protein
MRRVTARAGNAERGASAVFIAICIVVLMGFGALVIDVGAAYQERRELQNGADAGALAVAKSCVTGGVCPGSTPLTARIFANSNAGDGQSNVDNVCGNVAGVAACADPPTVATGLKYVRVKTSTNDANGGTQVSFGLARVLGFTGATVHAAAVAAWGALTRATAAPLTFSTCEFDEATNNRTVFSTGPPWVGPERYIYFHGPNQNGPCADGGNGDNTGNGFGWLVSTGCELNLKTGDWAYEDRGAGVPDVCHDKLATWQDNVVLFPLFGKSAFSGQNGNYNIAGFAAVHITGYRFPGTGNRWPTTFTCPLQEGEPAAACIRGHFIRFSTSGDPGGGTVYGASAIRIVG